ncbi:hypothetical protein D9758_013364 [Tetrapyrgos nigripes]|uniref:Transposase family Tnp2 protein n=1 Tax=Tetrapyrgos nigripes TaxID=182062 RepID=A0A8H5FMZ7_9AGAR|nr:hypothetical protein D9758_013364 [Tetrapyrgos nigripes]
MPRPAKSTTSTSTRKPRKRVAKKVQCSHCGLTVTPETQRKHLRALTLPTLSTEVYDYAPMVLEEDEESPMVDDYGLEQDSVLPDHAPMDIEDVDADILSADDEYRSRFEIDANNPPPPSRSNSPDLQPYLLREDEGSDTEHDRLLDEQHGVEWAAEAGWADDEDMVGLTFEDSLGEELEKILSDYEMTDDEIAHLRHFALKVETHMTEDTFASLPHAFPNDNVLSWKATRSEAASLAHFQPIAYHCCINSCCCFVGPHADETTCPYCSEPRYRSDGKRPQKHFVYVPLIPRLISFFRSQSMVEKLRYRSTFKRSETHMTDVFDAKLYDHLCQKQVVIGDQELPQKFFQFPRDIALGLSTDGFAPWRHRKKTCWPLLVYNYNLPPEIRFHNENILCVGVIPGPKKPKDTDSFAWPLTEELLKLSRGVCTFDVVDQKLFALHAYLIILFGDIPAMSLLARLVGHNGIHPCRMCNIRGICPPGGRTNYVPLDRSRHPSVHNDPSQIQSYDPSNFPMRNHEEMKRQAEEVEFAPSANQSKTLATEYGIKGVSIFYSLSSMVFPVCVPYDFMHLIFENVMKNLVLLWTGNFKGLDEGSAQTADSWSFWILYLGPVLLEKRFRRAIYYNHFISFVKLVKLCLEYEYNRDDIGTIREGWIKWVRDFEDLYYQHDPDRMSACPVTIHALLHLAYMIEWLGPLWAYWAFPTERYCGRIQPAIKSRRYLWACIDNYIVDYSRLSIIKVNYKLEEELKMKGRQQPTLQKALTFSESSPYKTCMLLPPQRPSTSVSDSLHNKIVIHFVTRFKVRRDVVQRYYNLESIQQWAKVRRLSGVLNWRIQLQPSTSSM